MNTKIILSLAVAAILPLNAMADFSDGDYEFNYIESPASVPYRGTVTIADESGPYVTVEPTQDDETHIATTAYVKGAYNDAVAAINSVVERVEGTHRLVSHIDSKKVRVYTTWDDDDTKLVPLADYVISE